MKYLYIRDKRLWKIFFSKLEVDGAGNLVVDAEKIACTETDIAELKKWMMQFKASQN